MFFDLIIAGCVGLTVAGTVLLIVFFACRNVPDKRPPEP